MTGTADARIGLAVDLVLAADGTRHRGTVVALGGEDAPAPDAPTIELADGRRVSGLDCWWCAAAPGGGSMVLTCGKCGHLFVSETVWRYCPRCKGGNG